MPGITVLRETIMSALQTKLGTISTANGYWSNMGTASVSQWQGSPNPPWSQDELPAMNFKDVSSEVITLSEEEAEALVRLTVEIQMACLGGTTAHVTMRQLFSDVYRCIGLWPNLGVTDVKDIRREGDRMESDQLDKTVIVGTVTLSIDYVEDQFPTT